MTITELIVCIVAGLGAGLGTGLAGLSAAAVVSPMLITFLHMPAYQAIGIALASDVLASGVSAWTYKKNKNIDIRHGVIMLISVLIFTLVGSFVSSLVPNGTMGGFSKGMTLLVGLKFMIRPIMTTKEVQANKSEEQKIRQSILCGVLIGFICGFVGAGGGMMLLLVLTSVLGYELKTAVGTSVFIMTFTALTGAVSHFAIGGAPDWTVFILCADRRCFTFLYRRKTEPSDYDCLCDQHTGVRAAWSKMGEQRKRKNAESRNRNPAVRAGNGDAVLLKKILSNTKPDRIFSYYESMQIRFSSLRPRKEFHPLYRKPCRLPGREMHLRYLLPRRFFEAGCG